jgi:hypothetical protein
MTKDGNGNGALHIKLAMQQKPAKCYGHLNNSTLFTRAAAHHLSIYHGLLDAADITNDNTVDIYKDKL